jgi:hypothetical protein
METRRSRPAMIVSDHGTEFTSNAMLGWTGENQIAWHFIAPGQADGQRLRGVLQRAATGRVPERTLVLVLGRREEQDRGLAAALQ